MQASQVASTPTLTPLSLSHFCSKYLQMRFRIELNAWSSQPIGASTAPLAPPLLLPVCLASELDHIALALANAFLNPEVMDWDATYYSESLGNRAFKTNTKAGLKKEKALRELYSLRNGDRITKPCIVTDMHGVILVWYLPGILDDSRQGAMSAATEKLHPLLRKSLKASSKKRSWRGNKAHFHAEPEDKRKMPSGVLNLSSGWFQQGHATRQKTPQVAALFREPAALDWLDEMVESNAILSAILAVIHPELYDAAQETLDCLRRAPDVKNQSVLSRWTSVFNGLSIICNRNTPLHRDGYTRHPWYDLLITLGNYGDSDLELPGLGLSLEYSPGTVVGLSGMMLEHAVPTFKGERVCYAYFMRANVHQWGKVQGAGWMRTDYYERHRHILVLQ